MNRTTSKLVKMLGLCFLITFVYEFIRPIKATLVVTALGSGAEIVPFLRMWVVLPISITITMAIAKLSIRYSRKHIFNFVIGFFVAYLLVFLTVLYPLQDKLSLDMSLWIKNHWLLLIFKYWPLSLLFAFCELWTTVVASILFWGYINEVTTVARAKKIYWALLLVGNSAVIVAGLCGQIFALSNCSWDKTIYAVLLIVQLLALVIIIIFNSLDSGLEQQEIIAIPTTEAKYLSVFKDRNLIFLTIIVIAYNISYNLIEVLWTSRLHLYYPAALDFSTYISRTVALTGIISLLLCMFVCRQSVNKFGWTMSAMITPCLWLLTGSTFFLWLIFEKSHLCQIIATFLEFTPLAFAIFIGALQLSMGKASKYTLFDQTKEMAFIPLSVKQQRIGKMWVEGFATWLGKIGAALIYQLFVIIEPSVGLTISVLYVFIALALIWLISVFALGKNLLTLQTI